MVKKQKHTRGNKKVLCSHQHCSGLSKKHLVRNYKRHWTHRHRDQPGLEELNQLGLRDVYFEPTHQPIPNPGHYPELYAISDSEADQTFRGVLGANYATQQPSQVDVHQ